MAEYRFRFENPISRCSSLGPHTCRYRPISAVSAAVIDLKWIEVNGGMFSWAASHCRRCPFVQSSALIVRRNVEGCQ